MDPFSIINVIISGFLFLGSLFVNVPKDVDMPVVQEQTVQTTGER